MKAATHLTNLMRADYTSVLNRLDDVQRVIEALDEPKAVLPDLESLGNFFRRDVWTLVWKEEDAVFPEIVRSAPREKSRIGRMLIGHQKLRGVNERFQRGVDGYRREQGHNRATALLCESGQEIAALLRNHIREESSMFEAAVQGVRDRGKAEIGDKTMLDALVPAADAMREAMDGGASLSEAVSAAADAADVGAKATVDLKSKMGRASWFSERTQGIQDPGATAVGLMLASLRDYVVESG